MKKGNIIFAIAITSILPVIAQDTSDLIKRDMVLEKDYNPQVETAGKIWSMPSLEPFKTQKTDILFSTGENLLHITGGTSTLKVLEGTVYLPDKSQKGYLRLGGGNHLHLIGDGQFNLVHTDNQWLDISLSHRSEQRGTEDRKWDNDSRLSVNYAANTDRLAFQASLSEEFYQWHYYGKIDPTQISVSGTTLKMPDAQWFSNTGLFLQLSSRPSDKAWNYGVSINENLFVLNQIYGFNDAAGNGPKELDSNIKAYLIGQVSKDWQVRLDINGRYLHTWNAPGEHASGNIYQDLPGNNFWFEIVPQVGYRWHLWSFLAGARFSQLTGGNYKFRAAPEISASTPLWKNASLKLVVNGGERVFSYSEGFRENLYIDPTIRLLPEYIPIHVGGKLYWRPAEMLGIVPYIGYRYIKDMAMFYNAPVYDNSGAEILPFNLTNCSFSALYSNVNHFYAGLEATFNWCEKIRGTADFRYNGWKGENVWYKPAMELKARIDVNAVNNLTLSATYQMQLQRYAAVSSYDNAASYTSLSDLSLVRIDDIHLLNIEATYNINRRISVFVQANNLLNRTSAWWNRYDINGITIAGGAAVTF